MCACIRYFNLLLTSFLQIHYSSCSVTVYAKPGIAQDPLCCPIELTGIDPEKTINISRLPPPPPSSNS